MTAEVIDCLLLREPAFLRPFDPGRMNLSILMMLRWICWIIALLGGPCSSGVFSLTEGFLDFWATGCFYFGWVWFRFLKTPFFGTDASVRLMAVSDSRDYSRILFGLGRFCIPCSSVTPSEDTSDW